MQIYDRNYDAKMNPARTVLLFENRVVNSVLERINFFDQFHRPPTPRGWEKVVEKYQPSPGSESIAPPAAAPAQARRTSPERQARRQ